MIESGYLRSLAGSLAIWLGLFLAVTWTIDPYGVSPIRIALPGINVLKPKRLDIDRVLKPYEVWRYQPRTIFLGTSRFQQAIDPSVLDGTRFAPAYNASIPKGSVAMNADYLRQYVRLDHNLRTVIVELFLNNFLGPPDAGAPSAWSEFIGNAVTLFASSDTLWASIATLAHNVVNGRPTFEIKPGGYLYYPPGHNPQGPFDGFVTWMWSPDRGEPDRPMLYPSVFESFREIIEIARAHDIELIFVATPNHAYVDYYYDVVGAWGLIEEWLVKLSRQATVYSFAQPNAWVYEPVDSRMAYWNDTFHFSLTMGRGMLAALARLPMPDLPGDFMERLTPERVASHIESRRGAVRLWAQANPAFVMRALERRKWLAGQAVRKPE